MGVRALLHGLVGGLAGAILVISGQVYGDRAATWMVQNVFEPVVGSNDGPLELTVRNEASGRYAMTELRAGNDARCYNDFLVTGSNYDDRRDGTLEANEASIVSESRCARMHIKANSGEIKFTTVAPGKTSDNLQLKDGVVHLAIADCDRAMHVPNTAGYLCGDKEGILWWCRSSVLDAHYRRIPYKTPYAFREEVRHACVRGASMTLGAASCSPPFALPLPFIEETPRDRA